MKESYCNYQLFELESKGCLAEHFYALRASDCIHQITICSSIDLVPIVADSAPITAIQAD